VNIAAGSTGTVTIKDNKFKMGPNCAKNSFGPGLGNGFIRIQDYTPAGLEFESNYVDGDMYNQKTATNCMSFATSGGATIKYNAMLRCDGRPIALTAGGGVAFTGPILVEYNYVEDYSHLNALHGEFILATFQSGTLSSFRASYDTILLGPNVQGTTALENETEGTGCCTIANAQIDHLVGIANGSNTASYIGWFGDHYGQVTIENNYVDLTGTQNGGIDSWGMSGGTCTNRTIFSGNVNLVSGASLNTWKLNTGAGC
jgi:hypothetical protein